MNREEFENFFRSYSENVDNANKHGFWRLSDTIITRVIMENIDPKSITKDAIILDAGGGTSRWICELSRIYDSKFINYDLSRDMLVKGKQNIMTAGIEDRVELIEGDLRNMEKIASDSVDHIISIYSPISFINNKSDAYSEMFRVLKKNGKALVMGHGFFNALASKMNNSNAGPAEVEKMKSEYTVKWAEHVPELNIFSKESLEDDLVAAGFQVEKTYGIPVFIQPGPEDFDPENKMKSRISKALDDQEFFEEVLSTEMAYNSIPTIVNRGMNMFAVAAKK